MKALVTLLALLHAPLPAFADSPYCRNMADMYTLAVMLRDNGVPLEVAMKQMLVFPFSEYDRQQAVFRVTPSGDLGFLSRKTIYNHIYLECTRKAS